ncbi:MAG TPA: hypothetical protein VMW91_01460 [Desulfosporosinus sp.]|nr:hypothetical protein [Desulfosporosinus sp.]
MNSNFKPYQEIPSPVCENPIETLKTTISEVIRVIDDCSNIADEIEGSLLMPRAQDPGKDGKCCSEDNVESGLNIIQGKVKMLNYTLRAIHRKI